MPLCSSTATVIGGDEFTRSFPTFAFDSDSRQLNLLPQETAAAQKEPVGIAYTDISSESSSISDFSAGEDSHKVGQLNQESQSGGESGSVERKGRELSESDGDQSELDNPIGQITDGVREEDTEPNKGTGKDQRNYEEK